MNWIFEENTIATTETTETGKVLLKLYYHKQIVFSKEYKTLRAAKTAMTLLLNGKFSFLYN